VNNSTKIKF